MPCELCKSLSQALEAIDIESKAWLSVRLLDSRLRIGISIMNYEHEHRLPTRARNELRQLMIHWTITP
jgi:hypothetical protein